ncbi:hypothetical protein PN498_21635 [Oscillatoria sp. CS-180]|nr:hypothetical protein [Oscillatoria sp. CS-180]MDB9528608.1 hypothetical protein [Oscillatoria sp. CS-180]
MTSAIERFVLGTPHLCSPHPKSLPDDSPSCLNGIGDGYRQHSET